ncbi:prolipoprotein diacylglyceryl transferase [Brevundimonas sp. 2R-24]|uniref:Phosphatidylglycerol--prolipoprotein diacylglyceryl transferase n=1 Tax=Peiella sedimenti TaxID=3061083 RepID=A0ABT8SQ17_9CAUL|nr:prolipoprotein diacylglyceryl transferase [Caulobacteraceae bacterium XZ-24]
MPFPEFDPVLIQLGPLAIRWYALAYVAGILLGWRYALILARNEAIWAPRSPAADSRQIDDLVLWITLGVILGGRAGYVLFYGSMQDPPLWTDPLAILRVWEGGMSFHGGALGVILAIVVFARANRLNLLSLGDLIAPVVPIGLFFGRVANFINGELWGRVTDVPWAVNFCNARMQSLHGPLCDLYGGPGPFARHPSQLYEAALEGVALFILLRLATHRFGLLAKPGYVSGLFLLGYGLVRALLETVREPDAFMPELFGGMTMGMLLSIPMILFGGWLIWRAWSRPAKATD